MNKSSRVCALCDRVVDNRYVVCKEHLEYYNLHKHDPWMIEMIAAARRQFEIDNEEIALSIGDLPKTTKTYKKLTKTQIELIKNYKLKGLYPDAISKLTGIDVNLVKYHMYRSPKK